MRLFLANETTLSEPHCWNISSGIDPVKLFSLKSRTCKVPMCVRLVLIGPLKLFLESERTWRNCNLKRPRPMCPERENPSRATSVTRLDLGSHLIPTQSQGYSASSFHVESLSLGSWSPALNTINPKTSSLKIASRDCVKTGAKRSRRNTLNTILSSVHRDENMICRSWKKGFW